MAKPKTDIDPIDLRISTASLEIRDQLPKTDEAMLKLWVAALLKYAGDYKVIKTVDMLEAFANFLKIAIKAKEEDNDE